MTKQEALSTALVLVDAMASMLDSPLDRRDFERELARQLFSRDDGSDRDTVVPPSKPFARVDVVQRRNPKDDR